METLTQDPEIVKTVLIGIILFMIGAQSATVNKPVTMTVCFFGTLVCVLLVWFKIMGGA